MDHLPPSYDTYWHNPLAPQSATAPPPTIASDLEKAVVDAVTVLRSRGCFHTAGRLDDALAAFLNSVVPTATRKP